MGFMPDLCTQTGTGRPVAREGPVVRFMSDVRRFGSGQVMSDVRSASVVRALGVVGRPVAPVVHRFGSGP